MTDQRQRAGSNPLNPGGRPKDESKLSRNPRQIRNRLRRKHVRMQGDLDMYQDEVYGKRIEDWDLEELSHGKPRNKNGNFAGGRPTWITTTLQNEIKRRLLEQTFGKLGGMLDTALKALKDLIESTEVDDNGKPIVDAKTKYAAATFIIEHVVGKPKAIIEIDDPSAARRQAIASAIVLDDGLPQGHLAIEGEWIENDDELSEDEGDE